MCTYCLGDLDQSYHLQVEVTECLTKPDDRTHSVKADKGYINTHTNMHIKTHTQSSLTKSLPVCLFRLWRRTWWSRKRGADKLCVCWMCVYVQLKEWVTEKAWEKTKVTADIRWCKILHKTRCIKQCKICPSLSTGQWGLSYIRLHHVFVGNALFWLAARCSMLIINSSFNGVVILAVFQRIIIQVLRFFCILRESFIQILWIWKFYR